MDYWGGGGGGGPKGMMAPPPKLLGGGPGPPSSYAYDTRQDILSNKYVSNHFKSINKPDPGCISIDHECHF